MGVCCVAPIAMDENIEKCQSINELINVMSMKKEDLPIEQKELKENIDNDDYIRKINVFYIIIEL